MITFTPKEGKQLHFDVIYENGVHLGEAFPADDGYVVFWPHRNGGFWDAGILRAIADKMNELNIPWDKQINEYFDSCPPMKEDDVSFN